VIDAADIDRAYAAIVGQVVRTPLIASRHLSSLAGAEVGLKLETLQATGAYKERGALNKLLSLTEAERSRGVIAASAGNHGQAVAYHAKRLSISAKIVMPLRTPLVKFTATQSHGAEIVLHGQTYDDAYARCVELANEDQRVLIHPFDDPLVIAGQGTIAVELLKERRGSAPQVTIDTVLCPIGGGGLIAGISTYFKAISPSTKVIGVEAEACPAMYRSVNEGRIVKLDRAQSLADGIAVKSVGEITFEIVKRNVDEILLANEDDIARAVLSLLEGSKLVTEGAGAIAVAALMRYAERFAGQRVVCIVSGGNIDVNVIHRIISRGLAASGRVITLRLRFSDVAGSMNVALDVLSGLQTNILGIAHHRFDARTPYGHVDTTLTLETKGREHADEIRAVMTQHGFLIRDADTDLE
jgi:threonine dehydratase